MLHFVQVKQSILFYIIKNVHGILPENELQPVDVLAPVDEVCTLEYLICPPGQKRIVNGCQQSCVPCGEISLPLCPKGYIARLSPPAENICPSYTCVPGPIRPPIKILPIEPVAY